MSANEATEAAGEFTPEQRQILLDQFIEVYGDEQKSYDSSVRALAAGGVAVTVSLATALDEMPAAGKWAVGLFLASLGLNLVSHGTAQLDMRARIACVRGGDGEGVEGNRWTKTTTVLNLLAGASFVAGGVLLAVFVGRSA